MLELLSPAGSMDALRAAVQNGADAVYLGLARCNARQGARNFSPDELREAVKYCHIRGVKVHLTLNTLLSDREMPQAAELIRTAAACDVDAFIVQDLGVVQLCRQMAPQIALHASTQMSIHNLDGVQQAAKMGVSRVVLARELDRAAIAYICRNSPVEIEVFVHGALCMCYSGQCYMSAVIGRRSGNRGQCAQPCRLPYGYSRQEDKYPLSLKDNCLLSYLRELEQMGVSSIKIEGRMKRPEYVATATRIYRAVLDGAPVDRQHLSDLQRAFSRQGFTQRYYTDGPGREMLGIRGVPAREGAFFAAARATYENCEAARVPVRFYALMTRRQGSMLAVQDEDGHICKTVGPPGLHDPADLRRALCRKLDAQRPKAVVPQGLALIQQIELLPVQNHVPAGARVPQDREFLPSAVDQLCLLGLTDAGAGAVFHNAVFRQHQREATVDDHLQRDGLGKIPDLGQRHLKAGAGRDQVLPPQPVHAAGIEDIELKIPPNPEPPGARQRKLAQIAAEHMPDSQVIDRVQLAADLAHLPVPDHPGQDHGKLCLVIDLPGNGGVRRKLRQGDIEDGGLCPQQRGRQLIGPLDTDRQNRRRGTAGIEKRLGVAPQMRRLPAAPQRSQPVEHVPPHGVDGRRREGKPRVDDALDFRT